jgi:uncharacterized membrane protein
MLVFKIILTSFFVFVGGAKLFRAKPLKDQFIEFGLPGTPILIIGALEVIGGVALLFPSVTVYAAIGLLFLLMGAIANHIKVKHPVKSMGPTIVASTALVILVAIHIF